MTCASCGRTNLPDSSFCSGCGASLAPRCQACGRENTPDSRFCRACGAALGAQQPAPAAVSRKIVTIVFADLIGSVSLHERLDAESARRVMDRYHRAMSAAVDVHGGRVVQLLGDGVLAAFGVPRVAEDDAIRAVRAAVGMQRTFRELARELGAAMQNVGLRVAVNTGEIVVGDDENSVMGDPTNVAARLQQEARDGDVIVGEGTQRLIGELVTLAPLGVFALRGRAETVAAYRVVSLDRPASQQAIAFVGRDEELRRLVAVYDAAVAAPAARLAVLLGSPGLGKSRLVAEFTRRAGERATVLAARCDADGGATFAPLAEALRVLLRIDEGAGGDVLRAAIDALVPGDESERSEDGQRARGERSEAERARIATGLAALLSGAAASPEETFFAVRRLLAALAGVRPVVLVIDDLHWAEPLLLDLVEHLVQWSSGVPLLVLVAARPELRDTRSSLATQGPLVAEVVTLTGLDAGAATRLAANVIGGAELPAALAGRVLATSEGNPLFVAELVRMLVLDGTLVRQGERWITTVEVSKLDMPATIHVLLAARIERLRPEDRLVLERAAVIGRVFSRAAVAHLMPRETHDLDARLEVLRRSELIEPDTGWFLGEPALRFHHVLIRDAAYRRVLKETRAELHERLADWIVARVGEAVEHDETIGWHLEQAHQNLRELGPLDAHGTSLGERAARHLGAAGRRALARDDLALAAGLLGRAIDRLDPEDSARADLALEWCEALLAGGDVGPAAAAIEELARLATDSERLRAWHTCFAGQLAALTDPQSLRATADAVGSAAEALASAGDAAGEAKAHSVRAAALARLGEVGACETALDLALAAARRARDRRRANAVLAGAPVAALWGPSPVTRASGRCLDVVRVLRITQGAPAVEAVALRCQAVLETLRGRGEAARRMIASSRRMVEELGIAQQLLESDVFAGHIELLEGDAEAAEGCLRGAYDGLRERGLGIDAARAAALLGRALLAQGRAAEAEALSHESEALAGDDLKAAIAWRGVRAEALALRGDATSAVELARAAVGIASATDALLDHADARSALATALRAAGRSAEADAEATRALDLWEAKGATLLVERAPRTSGASNLVPAGRIEATRAATRRVQPNFASEQMRRLGAALAARDAGALPALWTEDAVIFHHATGLSYGRDAAVGSFSSAFEATTDLSAEYVALATLGASLALGRLRVSAAGVVSGGQSFGAIDNHQLSVMEANASNQAVHVEIFAEHQLGEAVARLYGRFAELQPEGHARDAAAATARALKVALGLDLSTSQDEVFAPDQSFVDHRLLGFPSARGLDAVRAAERALREIADDLSVRVEEIFALRPDALILRSTMSGTHRDGGGRFERTFLQIRVFGSDGRIRHTEWFDVDREAEALARFDALTTPHRPARRVRPNAATAAAERVEAMVDARDLGALEDLFGGVAEVVEHPTGGSYDGRALVATWSALLRSEQAVVRQVAVATLGDSLALLRSSMSVASMPEGDLASFGPVQRDEIVLIEVGADGRQRRIELFAADHLRDAMLRLYERYAELQTEAPEHTRASNTARATRGLFVGEPALITTSPHHEFRDHRLMGLHGGHVRAMDLERWRHALSELAEDVSVRVDEISCLAPNAWLVRTALAGLDRRSGGRFEQVKLDLRCFDASGQMERSEWFDADREAEALARFEELTAPQTPARRVRSNAATALLDRMRAANAARDLAALSQLLADDLSAVHHPTLSEFGRDGAVSRFAALYRAEDLVLVNDPIATLGDSLVLSHTSVSVSALADDDIAPAGAYRIDTYDVREADAQGRQRRIEIFRDDHLADAIARLYERYAELLPEGPERERAAATAHTVAIGYVQIRLAAPLWAEAGLAADVEFVDHRVLGFPAARGAAAVARTGASLRAVADDIVVRVETILDLRPEGYVVRATLTGTDRVGGGPFERRSLTLRTFGADGRPTRIELFEADRDTDALARFDELTTAHAEPVRRVRSNASVECVERVLAAARARDLDGIAALVADDFQVVDYRSGLWVDREGGLARWRLLFETEGLMISSESLATLGDSLGLARDLTAFDRHSDADLSFGASETRSLVLFESNARGQCARVEAYPESRLADAVARLYERHADLLPEGAERSRAAMAARAVAAFLPGDFAAIAAVIAPDVESVDHRTLGFGSVRGAESYLRALRSLDDVAADRAARTDDVLASRSDALLVRRTTSGTDRVGGGVFEKQFLQLLVFGADGRVTHTELFDPDRDAEALTRFDELTAVGSPSRFENAATRAKERMQAASRARDFERFAALFVPEHRTIDRRRSMQIELTRDELLAGFRPIYETARSLDDQVQVLATRGDRLALFRECVRGEIGDSGPSEVEYLQILQADERGDLDRSVVFDPGDLDAAYAELDVRYHAGEGAPHAALLAHWGAFRAATNAREWEAARRLLPEDFSMFSHRRLASTGIRMSRDMFIESLSWGDSSGVRATLRRDHLRLSARSAVEVVTLAGSADGGAFEQEFVLVFGHDGGRLRSCEAFDLEQLDAALAHFEALSRRPAAPARIENAATRWMDQFQRAADARDLERMAALHAPSFHGSDRRALVRLEQNRDQALRSLEILFEHGSSRYDLELLATRGDRLALARALTELGDGDSGPSEIEWLMVAEVDAAGLRVAGILFDPDALDAAYTELDDRYAAGEAAPFAGLWETARRRFRAHAARDWETLASLLPADLVTEDHRPARWGTLRSRDEYLAMHRSLVDLAPDVVLRCEHVLGFDERGSLLVTRQVGSRDGGTFEVPAVMVSVPGAGGRAQHMHLYDPEQLDDARACYAASRSELPAPRFENAATRSGTQLDDALAARDRDRIAAFFAPEYQHFDRRSMVQLELDRAGYLAALRVILGMTSFSMTRELIATRGDRLALTRGHFEGTDRSIGQSEIELLSIVEVNDAGVRVATVMLDPDALDAAYAELDARYAAGEGAPYAALLAHWSAFRGATNTREWETARRLLPGDFRMFSHRRLASTGIRMSRDMFIESLSWGDASGVRSIPRRDHLRLSASAAVEIVTLIGSADGGAFEQEFVLVFGHDGSRLRSCEAFDLEQLDAALDHAAALSRAPAAPVRIENAATRSFARLYDAWDARDWERVLAIFAPGFHCNDDRMMMHMELDHDTQLRSLRVSFDMTSSRYTSEVIATRGDRLALARGRFEGSDRSIGPMEGEWLLVVEVDENGDRIAQAQLDADALDAGYAELDTRYRAGEATAHPSVAAGMREFSRAFAARDWEALAARCAPDIAIRDHRRLGWETLHGPAAYVVALRALVDLAPDTTLRLDHVEMREQGYLVVTVWSGTRDGGAFEEPSLMVAELDAAGRIRRFDQYETERLAEARARYDAIGAAPAPLDPLHIPPNAATRARVRTHEAFLAHDWAAIRAQVSDDFVFEDRGKRALLRGDVELWIASAQQSASPGVRREAEIVATLGDRIALERILYGGAPGGVEYEKETLRLTELDAGGRIRASITFDPDDSRAASVDLFERYARSDAGGGTPASLVEWVRAQNDHDLDRVRSVLPDDFVFHDRRRTGVGRLASAREFVASLAALFEQCSDAWMEILYVLDAEKHAHLSVGKTSGTLIDGGAFESVYLRLLRFEGDRCVGAELFELEDLDRARARFEELRPDPLRVPPNEAMRVVERWKAAADARDWDTLERLFSPDFQFEDRRRGIRDSGDRAKMFASFRVAMAAGARGTAKTLATAGDRLALESIHFEIRDGDALVAEIDTLQIMEIDAAGQVVAAITFDPDDRRAAAAEMFERFYRGEEGRKTPVNHIEFTRGLFAHDRARMRAALPDEFSFHDHRRTGIGPGGSADDYVAWMGAAMEQSDDLAVEALHHVAIAEHGTLILGRAFGTLRDGGAFESVNLRISRYEDGRWVGVESFEPGDLARARARFEELGREHAARRADPQGARLESRAQHGEPKASEVGALAIPPNGAVRVGLRVAEIVASRDWAALRALASADFEFDDRHRRALVRGGIDVYVRNLEFVRAWSRRRISPTLLATLGDRVFLDRIAYVAESDGSVFEGEFLRVVEIDAEGKLRAVLHFDADARRAASAELSDRYFRSEEARSFPATAAIAIRALFDHDLERLRAVLPDDFVLDDHRHTGLGRIEGAALFTQSMAALFEQAPDLVLEPLYSIAVGEYGALEMAHMFGTLAASGGDVESVYVRLFVYRGGRMIGMEIFEPEDLDRARARFEELRR